MEDKYNSDRPIFDEGNDEYNRSNFSRDIVKVLSDFNFNENYTIGIFAK